MSAVQFSEKIQCREETLSLKSRPLVMGILNVTPDSFSDGGSFLDPAKAVEQAQKMIHDGVDILDIGGESTRPGASYVSENEELQRIRPIVNALGKHTKIPLSIDTRKAAVAQMAIDSGASIVNDVSALQDDADMAQVIKGSGAAVVLMHRQGASATMQQAPFYHDVVAEIRDFLTQRVAFAQESGISTDQIIIDPGIGFGKTRHHNLQILAHLDRFAQLGQPLLVGLSRKALIGELTGKAVDEREFGNAAAVATTVWQGAHILRVHDVAAMIDAIRVAYAIRKSQDVSPVI